MTAISRNGKPLSVLRDLALVCRACPLEAGRTTVVFGEGNPHARLMIVGEAPGADEDQSGRPFQGSAGRELDTFLAAAKVDRKDVYIANVVMCRPPGNRPPIVEWIEACAGHLDHQIRVVNPSVILALGATSTCRLLGFKATVAAVRGRVHVTKYGSVVPSYHPSPLSLNRKPARRDAIREDLQLALGQLRT